MERFNWVKTVVLYLNVMKEISDHLRISLEEKDEEVKSEIKRLTAHQQREIMNYYKKMCSFILKLFSQSFGILAKITKESFEGETKKRNATSAFFRATILAYQKSNLFELVNAPLISS